MNEGTEITTRTESHDSRVGGVSIRAWLVLMLCGTVCLLAVLNPILTYFATGDLVIEIREPLYSLSVAAASYYFGQTTKKT